jgi:hypothetical protein
MAVTQVDDELAMRMAEEEAIATEMDMGWDGEF